MIGKQDIKIGVAGGRGRMGGTITRELQSGAWPGLVFAGATDQGDDPAALFAAADVIIDFTSPEATVAHAKLAAGLGKALVVGTTGLGPAQETALAEAARKSAVVYAANMSVGVNLLLALVAQAAAKLGPAWDIEIAETHHRHKKDAPSGTALALGKAAAAGRGHALDTSGGFDRNGAREPGAIGFSVQRGGDIVGEHAVSFFSAGERVVLSHIATDRALFARGAIQAAQWVANQPPGLYGMREVLGFET